jgi:alpha-beta hydrolase superfamily lysophospholipase
MKMRRVILTVVLAFIPFAGFAQTTDRVPVRGHVLTVNLYGTRGRPAALVSSGDGGWIHLGPQVAAMLAARGYFVVGVDARAYLSSFTSGRETLRAADEPADFKVLVDFAAQGCACKPLLVGVSEGAGLSVLAATDPQIKGTIGGVIALGLPDLNELGWRWRDAMIYLTHGVPNEPTFSTAAVIGKVAPVPLVAIHSAKDEFVPVDEIRRVMASAGEPKRLWIVDARDHRFSDNQPGLEQRLVEALAWIAGDRHPADADSPRR